MNGVRHSAEAAPRAAATARQTGTEASAAPELVTRDDISALRAIVEGTASSTGDEQNILERAAILSADNILKIGPELLPTSMPVAPSQVPLDLATVERNHMLVVLEQTGWVIEGPRGAARILGLHANRLRSRMKKLGITRTAHDGS